LHLGLPRAAASGGQVQLKVGVALGCLRGCFYGGTTEGSAPQVGVDHHPGGIYHLARFGPHRIFYLLADRPGELLRVRGIAALSDLVPCRFQCLTDQVHDPVTVERLGSRSHILFGENTIDAGKIAKLHLVFRCANARVSGCPNV
jgi:hypothetical protein